MSSAVLPKKIVLRKRRKELEDESLDIQNSLAADQARQDALETGQGEIYDKYNFSVSQQENLERLVKLADAQELKASFPAVKKIKQSREDEINAERKSIAKQIADKIFHLAQKDRDPVLASYLKVFQEFLAGKSVYEQFEIMNCAHEYFGTEYDAYIRERGERAEILIQILKRTGRAINNTFKQIIFGLDVKQKAREFYKILNSGEKGRRVQVAFALKDFTEKEITALREEYIRLSFLELAQYVNHLLCPVDTLGKEADLDIDTQIVRAVSRVDPKLEKELNNRASYEVQKLRRILAGRTGEEIRLFEECYNQQYQASSNPSKSLLREHLEERLKEHAETAIKYLAGFSVEETVQLIHKLLFPNKDELVDTYLTWRDEVPVQEEIDFSLSKRLGKRRSIWLSKTLEDRVQFNLAEIRKITTYLSKTQFEQVNSALNLKHKYFLDEKLCYQHRELDSRTRALLLKEQLLVARRIENVLEPIRGLTPHEMLLVKNTYLAIFGEDLASNIDDKLQSLFPLEIPAIARDFAQAAITGSERTVLSADLLTEIDSLNLRNLNCWDRDDLQLSNGENDALEIAEILNSDDESKIASNIFAFCRTKDKAELHALEHAFYNLSEPAESLFVVLQDFLTPEQILELEFLFLGYDFTKLIENIIRNPESVAELRYMPAKQLSEICYAYEEKTKKSLISATKNNLSAQTIVFLPEVAAFLAELDLYLAPKSGRLGEFKAYFKKNSQEILAFERACDLRFGPLRLYLKTLTSRSKLQPADFLEIMSLLEGLKGELVFELNEAVNNADFIKIMLILNGAKGFERYIEELYEILNPEQVLRRKVSGLKISQDEVNLIQLHLSGYYPEPVSSELEKVVNGSSGAELGEKLLKFFTLSTPDNVNPLMPNDPNWIEEMCYQVRRKYEQLLKLDFIEILRGKKVPEDLLDMVVAKVYGSEPTMLIFELSKCMLIPNFPKRAGKLDEIRVFDVLDIRGERMRERMGIVYRAYYHRELLRDLGELLEPVELRRRVMKALGV